MGASTSTAGRPGRVRGPSALATFVCSGWRRSTASRTTTSCTWRGASSCSSATGRAVISSSPACRWSWRCRRSAQLVWPGFFSEAVLGIAMVSVAAGFTCATAASVTRSISAGLAAGLLVAASYPRFYSYPKLLVPAVALWLVARYVRSHSPARTLGAGRVGSGGLPAAARPGPGDGRGHGGWRSRSMRRRGLGARAGAVARFVGMGLLIVSPYLLYVQVDRRPRRARSRRPGVRQGRAASGAVGHAVAHPGGGRARRSRSAVGG